MTAVSRHKAREDLNDILNVPLDVNISIVKKEVIYPELPALGACGNLVLNSESSSSNTGTADKAEEKFGDPAEIQECLALNQSLQRQFVAILNKIKSSLDKNISKQSLLRDETDGTNLDNETKLTGRKSVKLFSLPYFRDSRGLVPLDNEDTITKTRNFDITAYVQPPKPWSDEEKTRLLNGVLASALDFVLKNHKAKRDYLKSKLSSRELSDEELKQVKREIREIEKQIMRENKRSPEDLLAEAEGNIDWLKVSATDLEGLRSEYDCEIMWNNYLSMFVNKKPFKKEEDAKLKELVDVHNSQDWDGIAQLLGTRRSAIQCMERYQTKLNEYLVKKYWTPAEDEKLLEVIESVRVGNFIPWNQVLLYMDGRARHQIINRYERTLKITVDKGPWSKYEDAMLLACIAKFGPRWIKMVRFFPHRNSFMLRERFVNVLDSSLKIGCWTPQEDIQMGEGILKYGYKWSKVASDLCGRTDNMCQTRFKRLLALIKKVHKRSFRDEIKDQGFLLKYLPKTRTLGSHTCKQYNDKLKSTQSTALETLKLALAKISSNGAPGDIDLDKLDSVSLSMQLLEKVHNELKQMERKESEETGQTKPVVWVGPRYSSLRPLVIKEEEEESVEDCEVSSVVSETEEEEEEAENAPPSELEILEMSWLHKVLETKLQEECDTYDVIPLFKDVFNVPLKGFNFEQTIYEEYLRKELSLSFAHDISQMEKKKKFESVNRSVHDAVCHFTQPTVSDGELIVLPPNRTTLLGMDRILATKPRLTRTAHFVEHSTSYIRYLTGSKDEKPECLKCSAEKMGVGNSQETYAYQSAINGMKSKLLVVDETLETAARCETRYGTVEEHTCVCDALAKSKAQVDLLTKRFISLFFWPCLLSHVSIPSSFNEIVITDLNPIKRENKTKIKEEKSRKPKRTVRKVKEENPSELSIRRVVKKRVKEFTSPERKSKRICSKEIRSSVNIKEENEDES